ncbi:MAG: UDP-N-acetylmuramoyl-L-alanine--D-glutamate ligase [Candidatus Omnitrophota bacterium]
MRIDDFKRICVVGWGQSGISLCNLLLSLKKKVWVSELGQPGNFPQQLINDFVKKGVKFEFGGHSEKFIKAAQLLILSPGVDIANSSILGIIRTHNIPYVGEIEFSSWLTPAKLIAITGTNGKTTTAELTYQVLKQKRKGVFLGGNIGTPFSSFVLGTKKGDLIILELSSFQLETIVEFKPYLAVFLNIEPDHLDRYRDFKDYFQAKLNIFKNQTQEDWALLNQNIDFRSQIARVIKSRIVYFAEEFPNQNFSCVFKIATILGLGKVDCLNIFSQFKGLRHRLQLVRQVNKVTFINDSKATNPAATIWALKNTKAPIILLAGGKDKGLDYSAILAHSRKIRKIGLFGEAADKIKNVLNSKLEIKIFSSFEQAVLSSYREAMPGDTVLLSPMCSSFDMFSDYQARGDKFIEIVNSLKP